MSLSKLFPHAGALLVAVVLANSAFAQHGYYRQPCPCPDGYIPEAAAPEGQGMDVPGPDAAADDVAMPAPQDVASAPTPVAHNMIGDFFGNGIYVSGDPTLTGSNNSSLPIAGGDRRYKVSDNLSPFPTDRLFFNFHQFNNAVTDVNDISRDVSRFTFGFEKTFFCEQASIEVRIPFVEGLNSDQTLDGSNNTGTEFGNVIVMSKFLLYDDCCGTSVSAGFGVSLPTADNARMYNASGLLTQTVENNAVNITPYVGFFKDYGCDGWFTQGYVAVDFEASRNSIIEAGSTVSGDIDSATLLFIDWQVGKWIYRNDCCCSSIVGVAPIVELHYTTTLDNGSTPSGFDGVQTFGSADIVNLTAGVKTEFSCGMLNVYGALPLYQTEREIGDSVKEVSFDSEFGIQYIRFF